MSNTASAIQTREKSMIRKELTVRFNTPAFLGNAEQSGQWRTPPFKHLLREWWRVAWAEKNPPSKWRHMREMEGKLFGHAWLENDVDRKGKKTASRKSNVILRLDSWRDGTLNALPRTRPAAQGAPVSALYLGYGPVKNAQSLNMAHPIDEGKQATLRIAYPSELPGAELMERTVALIDSYGTVGGRSRNGWGSVTFDGASLDAVNPPLRDWTQCLREEWAHAIGEDERALIWTTRQSHRQWQHVIEELAAIRKGVNSLCRGWERAVLNQPVGGKGDRVPSNLRFKIRRDANGEFYGVIFHMPFSPPSSPSSSTLQQVWQGVHQFLDGNNTIQRSPK